MYEKLFRHALLPLFETAIKRRPTMRYLAEYEASQWLDAPALAQRQLERLNALLEHAWRKVPFLQAWWGGHGAPRPPLRDLADLAGYPMLTKDVIREHFQELVAGAPATGVLSKTTGGSTGTPLRLAYTQDSYAARTALMWRGYRWAGTDIGRRTAYLWGQPLNRAPGTERKERLYHALFNRLMLNSVQMRADNLQDYVQAINRFRPRTIVGYTTPLATLAHWIVDHGIEVHAPDRLLTGAEALHRPQREVIEKAFAAPVFNTYGCREFGLMASQCEAGALHISADHLVLETVDDGGRPVSGRPGQVVITDLSNYALPFVRYALGDLASLGAQACPCGRGLPVLESLHGRTLDLVRTRDGRLVPGEYFQILFYDWPTVLNFQVIQHDLDHLELKLVMRPGDAQPVLARILERLRETLGHDIQITLNQVDDLPRTPQGKLRVTISHVTATPPAQASR